MTPLTEQTLSEFRPTRGVFSPSLRTAWCDVVRTCWDNTPCSDRVLQRYLLMCGCYRGDVLYGPGAYCWFECCSRLPRAREQRGHGFMLGQELLKSTFKPKLGDEGREAV
ncbi:hypothetical protein CesoFtcFv8_011821 [Champsocephalus esox]|uniref:Uncharacterized protein n=1 Tax=Champsocephalus esox TaxID=159716 RepID=A0AAN8GXN0_9TELE|nr:hypothetical protein CesoFtcFv8_011821 [Champsocephalus esox]